MSAVTINVSESGLKAAVDVLEQWLVQQRGKRVVNLSEQILIRQFIIDTEGEL